MEGYETYFKITFPDTKVVGTVYVMTSLYAEETWSNTDSTGEGPMRIEMAVETD